MNVLFLGGSTTDCGHCFTKDNLGNGYVKKLSLLPGITATNGGTDGFTFPDVLRKWRLMYAQNTYDCIVVTCGINDVGVIADLKEAGRHETACTFLKDSIEALRTFLAEAADLPERTLCEPDTEQESDKSEHEQSNPAFLPAQFPHAFRILLLEPFLFPIPQARMLWLPILTEVRSRIRETVSSYNVALRTIPGNTHTASASYVQYVPTQAVLDGLAARIGYPAVTTDGIHLTDKGHECLAELVAWAMGIGRRIVNV